MEGVVGSAKKVNLVLRVLILGLLFMAGSDVEAREVNLFPFQESIEYRVSYGPARLADMHLEVQCREGYVEARLKAESMGLARRVHPFEVVLESRARVGGGSEESLTWIDEKGEERWYRSAFEEGLEVATEVRIGARERRDEVKLPARGYDLLSWMLHLRRQVAREGRQEVGRRYTVWDGWKLSWLDVVPQEVERVMTPAGEVEAQGFRLRRTLLGHELGEAFEVQEEAEEVGTVWLEVAPRAMPVAMHFLAPIGRVKIELVVYEERAC